MSFVIVHYSPQSLSIYTMLICWYGQSRTKPLTQICIFGTHIRCAYNFTCLINLATTTIQCWKLILAISPDFQYCIGWGGGRQHISKRMAALFPNFTCKTQINCYITQVAQGFLSKIVANPVCKSQSQATKPHLTLTTLNSRFAGPAGQVVNF